MASCKESHLEIRAHHHGQRPKWVGIATRAPKECLRTYRTSFPITLGLNGSTDEGCELPETVGKTLHIGPDVHLDGL